MAYMSTVVTKGKGRGMVVATGMQTEIGKIAKQLKTSAFEKTPLQRKMDILAYCLFGFGLALAVAVYGANQWIFDTESTLYAIALALSCVFISCYPAIYHLGLTICLSTICQNCP
jgi:magnesium-transporting ATPase (P-type)